MGDQEPKAERPEILAVLDGTDRAGNPLHFLNGRFDCRVSGSETNGRFCIFDTVRTTPGGPPLHVHHAQEEWFFVREGTFLFQIGESRVRLGAGDSILAPRGIPHAFVNETATARLMILFQPAGSMEAFFEEGGRLQRPTRDDLLALHQRHGMELVGAPLSPNP